MPSPSLFEPEPVPFASSPVHLLVHKRRPPLLPVSSPPSNSSQILHHPSIPRSHTTYTAPRSSLDLPRASPSLRRARRCLHRASPPHAHVDRPSPTISSMRHTTVSSPTFLSCSCLRPFDESRRRLAGTPCMSPPPWPLPWTARRHPSPATIASATPSP